MAISAETMINEQKSENDLLAEKGFYWRETNDVKVLVCKALEENGFANGFSTRVGGVSPLPENSLNLSGFDFDTAENILENRRRFLACFDGNYKLSTVWQIHSDLIKTVTSENLTETEEKFDALIGNLENILVGVKTADCVPVLLGDSRTKSYSAIHAGWRGTVQSIVPKAVERMKSEFGTNPNDLFCAIGPAASGKCYEVGQDVIDAFHKEFSTCGNLFVETGEGHALIDLHQANREQLQNLGVLDSQIFTTPFCTMERTDLFFSYRVDRKKFGKTGRLLSVIGNRNK